MKIIKTEQYILKESGIFDVFKSKKQNNINTIDYSKINTLKDRIKNLTIQYNMAKTRRDFAAMKVLDSQIKELRQQEHDILDSQYANFQN